MMSTYTSDLVPDPTQLSARKASVNLRTLSVILLGLLTFLVYSRSAPSPQQLSVTCVSHSQTHALP